MPQVNRTSLRRTSRTVAAAVAGRLGYELVRKHFYSPIPDLAQLPADIWTRAGNLPGLHFDPAECLEFLQRELAPHLAEYHPATAATEAAGFHLDNGLYGSVDAETLYAMVRRFAPRRIVELGSGMSTLVIADARERSGAQTREDHAVYDPYPREDLRSRLEAVATVHPISATEVPERVFAELSAGDLLFVDTTHTVKIGGDVNRVVLDVLPCLAPGVIVHIHDIYLPFEYPREFLAERRFFWAEQYLLQAFLAFNGAFEVLLGNHALARLHPAGLGELVPLPWYGVPSGFWLRRLPEQ